MTIAVACALAACEASSSGGADAGASGDGGGAGQACRSSMDCGGATPICATDGVRTFCVECVEDGDCPSGRACDATRGVCGAAGGGECRSDADCAGATPICATDGTRTLCVECLEDRDCPGGRACDPARGACSASSSGGCASDADCAGATPICATDGSRTFCVECVEDGDCAGGACDPSRGSCR